LYQLEKLIDSRDWVIKRSGRWLTTGLSDAIKHLPDKEGLIFKVFKSSVVLLLMFLKSPLFRRNDFASAEFKNDRAIVLEAVKSGYSLDLVPPTFQTDREIVLEAVKKDFRQS